LADFQHRFTSSGPAVKARKLLQGGLQLRDAGTLGVVHAVLVQNVGFPSEQFHILGAAQAPLQVLKAQAVMVLARLAPARDASAGEAMEPPGDCAQHTHHNERTQWLDEEERLLR
jgi:hypothetical protein